MTREPSASVHDHPRRDVLAALVRTLAWTAADERSHRLADGLDELMRESELSVEDGAIGEINVLEALQRVSSDGAKPSADERRLLGELLAAGVASATTEAAVTAQRICWLCANTFLDASCALDDALGPDAEPVWTAIGELVRQVDENGGSRGVALAGLAALRGSESSAAKAACADLDGQLNDPLLRVSVARTVPDDDELPTAPQRPTPASRSGAEITTETVEGRRIAVPLGPLGLVVQGVTGILLLRWIGRFVMSVLLRRKQPASVIADKKGIRLAGHTEIVGRKLAEHESHIPFDNLARAEREVRYPRLGVYAGLIALALGTFLGVLLISDGSRAASPPMIMLGAGVLAAGLILDMLLSSVLPGRNKRVRLVFVPRKGRAFALSVEDEQAAARLLRAVARRD